MNRHPKPTTLGSTLVGLRQRAGFTLYELAKRADINRSNLHRMENGVITNPSRETLNRLALALDVDPETLYDLGRNLELSGRRRDAAQVYLELLQTRMSHTDRASLEVRVQALLAPEP